MPQIMTFGGIALAVLGLLLAIAGMPDRAAGLGLGSDLIQSGAVLLAGGLVVAALGQVLKALRDVAERVEEAGLGAGQRASLNDELSERAPMPLPRASRAAPAPQPADDEFDDTPETPPVRAPRSAPAAPRAPVAARPAPEPRRPLARAPERPSPQPESDFDQEMQEAVEGFPPQRPEAQPAPRWMRAQADGNRQPPQAGVIPMQQSRQPRATPVAPPTAQPRREAPQQSQAKMFDPSAMRRQAPQSQMMDEQDLHEEPTVVRSGIIAGMAYTLYSDRSIEAELPAGTVRFGSIEELQEHVKRAGVDEQEEYRGPNSAQH